MKDDLNKDNFKETDTYHQLISRPTFWIHDDLENADDRRYAWLRCNQLVMGRHSRISLNVINHLPKNGMKAGSREVITESHCYILMAPFGTKVKGFLETYMDFDDQMCNVVRNMLKVSRYCAVYRDLPYLVGQHKIIKYTTG